MAGPQRIDVHLLPALVEPQQLARQTVVVIDVLRATTTIIHALAAGAASVAPCLELDEARRIAAGEPPGSTVLGGERGGLPILGFDVGNSPREYTPQRVGGKLIVFTTTNGTRALLCCKAARRVLIGAFVNFSAVCRVLRDETEVSLLCAGTNGHVTREDTLFAGAVVDKLTSSPAARWILNDQAEIATDAWRSRMKGSTGAGTLSQALRASCGGRNLIATGQEDDIELAAQIDKLDFVPELDLTSWRIVRQASGLSPA
ncbi:MAG: 2-phosphosulfolactate phosphatase [Planctomycetaceae bacterium]|nr:2-phosphosulfolactate phosphatase [Planctomycetaceae bacterium]